MTPASVRLHAGDNLGLMIKKKNSKNIDTGILTRKQAQQIGSPQRSISDLSILSKRPSKARNFGGN